MRKELVIISVVGLCFAFSLAEKKEKPSGGDSDEPGIGKFKSVDVMNPKVQAAAQLVLAGITQNPACSDVTLIDVTKAGHKHGGAGIIYDLKLRFRTADNEIKKCKVKVWGSGLDFGVRQTVAAKPKPAPYQEGCRCDDLSTDLTNEDVIKEEEDC